MSIYQILDAEGGVINTISADQAFVEQHYPGRWVEVPAEPQVPPVASLQAQVRAIRDRKIQQGGYKVGTDWFHSDTLSRTQQLGLVMMGAGIPPGLMWKTMSGAFVEMAQSLAGQIFSAAAAQDTLIFAHSESLQQQIAAAEDPMSVDINAGWPETYGGI